MNAIIRCRLHLNPDTLTEDEWHKAWGQVKYYLENIEMVNFHN